MKRENYKNKNYTSCSYEEMQIYLERKKIKEKLSGSGWFDFINNEEYKKYVSFTKGYKKTLEELASNLIDLQADILCGGIGNRLSNEFSKILSPILENQNQIPDVFKNNTYYDFIKSNKFYEFVKNNGKIASVFLSKNLIGYCLKTDLKLMEYNERPEVKKRLEEFKSNFSKEKKYNYNDLTNELCI